ncbi:MAG: efflux RND transporter periplasmic adaptor subunit [Beijerinckiaceae bacterium]
MKKVAVVLTVILLAAGSAGLAGWKYTRTHEARAAARTEPLAPAITVARARVSEVVESVSVTGTLVARNEILAGPEIEGLRIVEILVDEGDRVAKGAVLVRLSRDVLDAQLAQSDAALARSDAAIAQARSQIAQSEANAKLAAADLERAQALSRSGNTTQAILDLRSSGQRAAEAQLQAARDAVRAAEADRKNIEAQRRELMVRIARTEVRTPAAGVVARKNAKLGAVASAAGEPLFRIIEEGEIELEAEIPEARIGALAAGQKALVTVADGAKIEGRVRLVSPEVDRATRLGRVRVSLASSNGVRVGAFARAEIEVRRQRAVTAPVSALTYGENGARVLVADKGIVRERPVVLGLVDGVRAEIRRGISEGDEIVVRAGAFLRDGDSVRPVEALTESAR